MSILQRRQIRPWVLVLIITPNAEITVDPFVDAFSNTAGTNLVPQQGTAERLDTLGDKIMTPLVYQSRNGTESLWASGTVCTDQNCTGPTGVRWYQFDVTGGNFPATPVQQQTWTNGNDGLWRWMSSIAVDQSGNTAIGYSASSSSQFPSIRYAGRLEGDPPGNLGQGEAIMFNGGGAQTSGFDRWGDYTMTVVDPSDGMTFWHVNQYCRQAERFRLGHTRIGKFDFVGGGGSTNAVRQRHTRLPRQVAAVGRPGRGPAECRMSRSAGVFFPANGKFYAMGGAQPPMTAGGEFTHPFEYDPGD